MYFRRCRKRNKVNTQGFKNCTRIHGFKDWDNIPWISKNVWIAGKAFVKNKDIKIYPTVESISADSMNLLLALKALFEDFSFYNRIIFNKCVIKTRFLLTYGQSNTKLYLTTVEQSIIKTFSKNISSQRKIYKIHNEN